MMQLSMRHLVLLWVCLSGVIAGLTHVRTPVGSGGSSDELSRPLNNAFMASASPDDPLFSQFDDVVGTSCSRPSDCSELGCVNGICEFCRTDSHCAADADDESKRCYLVESDDPEKSKARNSTGAVVDVSYCIEKDLFDPFTWVDGVASIVAFISSALGSGCGVGGGGLLVPMFILIMGLSPKRAIPLSTATIFGNAIAIYLFNVKRKHPYKFIPIINYAVVAVMEPPALIGTVLGVVLNRIFPNWLILLLLLTLLSYTSFRTIMKGNKIRAKESQRKRALMRSALEGRRDGGGHGRRWSIYRRFDVEVAARHWLAVTRRNRRRREVEKEDHEDFATLPPMHFQSSQCSGGDLNIPDKNRLSCWSCSARAEENEHLLTLDHIERQEKQILPWRYLIPLILTWFIILLQSLIRGGSRTPSLFGIECNSALYWVFTFAPLAILVFLTYRVGYRLRLENRLRVMADYPFVEGDIHWTKRRVLKYPSFCVIAGTAAGLLGIGGGMVKGPIMLEMGILPMVQTASTGFMVLFTSSSTTLQFAIASQFPGRLQYDYVCWFTLIGFLAGLCGQVVVAHLVKKYKRESIMVHLLGVTIGLSAIAMGVVGARVVIHNIQEGVNLGFSSVCGLK